MDAVRRFFNSLADTLDAWARDFADRLERRSNEAYARGLEDGVAIGRQSAREAAELRQSFGQGGTDYGWFADHVADDEREERGGTEAAPWAAFVQVADCCHALDGVWFTTKDDCWRFVENELAGLPALPRTP